MQIIDAHCDALYKLQLAKRGTYFKHELNFRDAPELETNLYRLQQGKVKVQFFAIFVYPEIPSSEQWQHALEQVDVFHTEVIGKNPEMKHIKSFKDIALLKADEIGAVLTLEGLDCIGNDLMKLETLIRLGVLSVGLTWNNANLYADGIGEERGAGLTALGKEAISLINKHKLLTDVSHLSDQAFWEVLELADHPFASHSNARAIHPHKRNLPDEAIQALFEKGGQLDVVFHPSFISDNGEETDITDLIRHIEHLYSLGGKNKIGFGSDFDGIEVFVKNLEHAGKYQLLINELLNYFPEETVKGFAYKNMMYFLARVK
ncbi:dipeptidase [Oceanobacillus sp. CAU 1775]